MPVECADFVTEINIADWGIGHQKGKQRRPLSGSIELTERCNYNCRHCFINKNPNDARAKKRELSTGALKSIVDQLVAAECFWLLITGGEPMLRKDCLDIYGYAKQRGLLLTVFTNGSLITPRIADFFKKFPPRRIEITLYGATKKTFEAVTRTPGSFEATRRGIRLLRERNLPLSLKAMALVENVGELKAMERFAESLGINDFRFDPMINRRIDRTPGPERTRLSPEQAAALDKKFPKRLQEWKDFTNKFYGSPQTDRLFICGAGMSSFHINPYGEFSLCIMSRQPNYNLKKGSFKQAWEKFVPTVRALKPGPSYKCARCPLIALCGQCPGWSFLETSKLDRPIEYLCRLAHRRAKMLEL
jgi:radical SAM protein with 4Fe4S-binding SPASM domain